MMNLLTKFVESLGANWRGYERLWVVFWIYYVPVFIVLGFVPENPPSEWYLWVPMSFIPLVWLIWIMVSLWSVIISAGDPNRIWHMPKTVHAAEIGGIKQAGSQLPLSSSLLLIILLIGLPGPAGRKECCLSSN